MPPRLRSGVISTPGLLPTLQQPSTNLTCITNSSLTTSNSITSNSTNSTHLLYPRAQQIRHATLIRRPHRPYTFTQVVVLSDGATYTQRTTSPAPVLRSTRDSRNTLLWQPTLEALQNREKDEAGRLAAFRERFGRVYEGKPAATTVRKREEREREAGRERDNGEGKEGKEAAAAGEPQRDGTEARSAERPTLERHAEQHAKADEHGRVAWKPQSAQPRDDLMDLISTDKWQDRSDDRSRQQDEVRREGRGHKLVSVMRGSKVVKVSAETDAAKKAAGGKGKGKGKAGRG